MDRTQLRNYILLHKYLEYDFVKKRPLLKSIITKEIDEMEYYNPTIAEVAETIIILRNSGFSWQQIARKFGIRL